MKPFGSVEAVVAALEEDARAELEKIEREFDASLLRLREDDAQRPVVVTDADGRIGAARRRTAERLAEEDWADRRAALVDREVWMQQVAREGERLLAALDPAGRRADLLRLAREALDRVDGAEVDVTLSPGDVALADAAWRDDAARESGKRIRRVAAAETIAGGCIVEAADGRVRYDNTYETRARRFESAWRAALGELFERATRTPAASSKVAV